jgi:hypothetical protein
MPAASTSVPLTSAIVPRRRRSCAHLEGSVTLDSTDGNPKNQDVRQAVAAVTEKLADCLAKWEETHG